MSALELALFAFLALLLIWVRQGVSDIRRIARQQGAVGNFRSEEFPCGRTFFGRHVVPMLRSIRQAAAFESENADGDSKLVDHSSVGAHGDNFLQFLAGQLRKRFGANIAVFISHDCLYTDTDGQVRNGLQFENQLRLVAEEFLRSGSRIGLGFSDEALVDSLVGDFSAHGVRFSASDGIETAHGRLVFWLGFVSNEARARRAAERSRATGLEVRRRIEERVHYEETLARAAHAESESRAKSTLITYASHDIRSPLANIRAALGLIPSGQSQDGDLMVERAFRNCDMLGDIVEDLLDFSRSQSGCLNAVRSTFELTELVRAAVLSFEPAAEQRSLSLRATLDGEPVFVRADRHQMRRILGNLISNALKYTTRGWVAVTLCRLGDRVLLSVKDSGCGMSSAAQQRVFSPYLSERVEEGGSGIGLALSQTFAALNDVQLSINSQIGIGTEVVMTLDSASVPVEYENPKQLCDQFSRRVLVVDDDADFADSLLRTFAAAGVRGDVAYTAPQALEYLAEHRYDAVLSDFALPGVHAAAQIFQTAHRTQQSARRILLTGYDIRSMIIPDNVMDQVDVLLKKPVPPDELLRAISAAQKSIS